jgi:RNA polymerase sigma-70 factor (ECF subfamily)
MGDIPRPLDHEQFTRLLLSSEREVFRYIVALVPNLDDAQEIWQETAVALWRKIDQYDPARPFSAWACRFALNESRAFQRKTHRWRSFMDDDVAEALLSRRERIQGRLDRRRELLQHCLGELSGEHRTLIQSYYYRRDSVQAMAEGSGRTAEAIYKVLQRIRHALLKCMSRDDETPEAAS